VISALLNPLESTRHVNIIFHPANRTLVLDLPQFSLSFTLVKGKTIIKSKQYSGICIDKCQNIGALIGLQNKLILIQEDVAKFYTPSRIALVPRGKLSSQKTSNHVIVSIDCSSEVHIKHDTFAIDSRLSQLVSSGSLLSKFHLYYLHSVTSHYLPDPLTGRTGTEEALRILRSASVWSFQRLDAESYGVLCEIANISPRRVFYPEHLQDIEQVKWSDKLPVLSQHDAFRPSVKAILNHAQDCEIFHQSSGESASPLGSTSLERSSPLLVRRAKIRNSTFRVSDFGAEEHTAKFDRRYLGRHRGKEGSVSRSFTRARLVTRSIITKSEQLIERPSPQLRRDILEITRMRFSGYPEVDITFKLEYLQPHSTSLARLWCGLHLVLTKEPNKYKITFFLSALLHAEGASWDVVQALIALANIREKFHTTQLIPPTEASFNLIYKPISLRECVEQIVKTHTYQFHECPEASLPQQPSKS